MQTPHTGLLPLYLELYDRAMPEVRPGMEAFLQAVCDGLTQAGVRVTRAPVCRLAREVDAALASLQQAGVESICTLHLAYSPSLESADALCASHLPLIVLDTTPDRMFAPETQAERIMYNHGIHGVQDLCSVLRRRRRPYRLAVGPCDDRFYAQAVHEIRGAAMARRMHGQRVGRIGPAFTGMGDFAVSDDELADWLCATPVEWSAPESPVTDGVDWTRWASDSRTERCAQSERDQLAVLDWIRRESLSAFSANFTSVPMPGLQSMPFAAACLAMAQGIGYAGEGDLLTALTVGAVASVRPETSFCEMFCPDWDGGRVFLSHMGEANPAVLDSPEWVDAVLPWCQGGPPVRIAGCFRAGDCWIVNVAPGPDGLCVTALHGHMVDASASRTTMPQSVRGWFTPSRRVEDALRLWSRHGGTHHSALVYGPTAIEWEAMADWLCAECLIID